MTARDTLGRATLVAGIVLTVIGTVLLFFTQNIIDVVVRWWPIVFTVVGLFFLYKVFFRKARPGYLFNGLLLLLTGLFIVALNTLTPDTVDALREWWPVFMGIVGLSLIPYGARYRRAIRVSLVIPGIFLILLMVAFLLFSFSVVKEPLAEFVGRWWPLLLVFMGVTLMVSSWLRQLDNKE